MCSLSEAAAIVKAFMDTLDTSERECGCCGRIAYNNLTEKRAHQELAGVVSKLERQAAAFKHATRR